MRRRCGVLLGHRRRWGTHAAACVGPAQAARARYLPGTMPGPALHRRLSIHCTPKPTHNHITVHYHRQLRTAHTLRDHCTLTPKLSGTKDEAHSQRSEQCYVT